MLGLYLLKMSRYLRSCWRIVLPNEDHFGRSKIAISSLKEKILEKANNLGFSMRPVWKPLHQLKKFKSYPRMEMKITENLEKKILNLPSSVYLLKNIEKYGKKRKLKKVQ